MMTELKKRAFLCPLLLFPPVGVEGRTNFAPSECRRVPLNKLFDKNIKTIVQTFGQLKQTYYL
jgi:hypothetical protein